MKFGDILEASLGTNELLFVDVGKKGKNLWRSSALVIPTAAITFRDRDLSLSGYQWRGPNNTRLSRFTPLVLYVFFPFKASLCSHCSAGDLYILP